MTELDPIIIAPPSEPRKIHLPTLLQFALSILTVVGMWGMALFSFQTSLLEYFSSQSVPELATSSAAAAFSLFIVGVLVLPSAGFAFLRLIGRSPQLPENLSWIKKLLNPNIIILLFPIAVLIGSQIPASNPASLILFPVAHVLGVGLPVWWLLNLAKRNLAAGSQQRQWGLFASGMAFSIIPILFAEIVIGILIFVIALVLNPGLIPDMQALVDRFAYVSPTPEQILPFVEDYVTKPLNIFLMLLFFSLAVPLIEEFFKPIGLWFLVRRKLTPQQGFAAGAISGAGFGFLETLLSASSQVGWGAAIIVRVGTAIMHILTSGIIGWGFAQAFTKKRYARLAVSYLASVSLHGAWNIVPVLIGVTSISVTTDLDSPLIGGIVFIGLGLLAVFSLVAFAFLVYINRRLSKALEKPSDDHLPLPESQTTA